MYSQIWNGKIIVKLMTIIKVIYDYLLSHVCIFIIVCSLHRTKSNEPYKLAISSTAWGYDILYSYGKLPL